MTILPGMIIDPRALRHPAYEVFKQQMTMMYYTSYDLNAAWIWFRSGWDAAEDRDPPLMNGPDVW